MRFASRVALAAAGACVLSACSRNPESKPKPNVLLVVVDALRADHLSPYGYARPTSPTMSALAARATLFTGVHSTTSWTNPAVESLFTGGPPRVLRPGAARFIAPQTPTLAALFRANGYRTAAIIGNPSLPPDLGFGQGFDQYTPVTPWASGVSAAAKLGGEHVNAAALEWLRRSDGRPWFLYLHYMDTHWPYEPPLETARTFWRADQATLAASILPLNHLVRERRSGLSAQEVSETVDLYDAAIAHLDAQLAALLDALDASGQLANTVLCVTADHGEELGDHGGFLHARTLFEEVLHIPLVIGVPGGGAARVDEPFQISDVGRLLLDAAGLQAAPFPGRSLHAPAPEALLAALFPVPFGKTVHERAVLLGADKLILGTNGQRWLFNLKTDAGEHDDVSARHGELVAQLEQHLGPAYSEQPAGDESAAAVRERMRALGYDF